MTPIIVAVAVAVVIVVGVFLVMMTRSRRDDEGERFRRVADLTSRWSRQVQGARSEPIAPYGVETERETERESELESEPESEPESGTKSRPEMARRGARKTESVDPS